MVASIRQNIPAGKFRVIGCDLFDHSDYVVKDCDTQDEAFKLADEHNAKPRVAGRRYRPHRTRPQPLAIRAPRLDADADSPPRRGRIAMIVLGRSSPGIAANSTPDTCRHCTS